MYASLLNINSFVRSYSAVLLASCNLLFLKSFSFRLIVKFYISLEKISLGSAFLYFTRRNSRNSGNLSDFVEMNLQSPITIRSQRVTLSLKVRFHSTAFSAQQKSISIVLQFSHARNLKKRWLLL